MGTFHWGFSPFLDRRVRVSGVERRAVRQQTGGSVGRTYSVGHKAGRAQSRSYVLYAGHQAGCAQTRSYVSYAGQQAGRAQSRSYVFYAGQQAGCAQSRSYVSYAGHQAGRAQGGFHVISAEVGNDAVVNTAGFEIDVIMAGRDAANGW